MEIIEAGPDHLDMLVPLFEGYRAFYRQPANIEGARSFLHDRMSNQQSIVYLAIDEDGVACGFTQLYPLFSSTRIGSVWLLNDLFVHPDHRGKGISIQLIDSAKELAKSSDSLGILLETEKTNDIGNQLYPRTGFVIEDDTHHYFWSTSA